MSDDKRPKIVFQLRGCAYFAAILVMCITALVIAMFAYGQTQDVAAVISACFWLCLKILGILLSICAVVGSVVGFIIYREGK